MLRKHIPNFITCLNIFSGSVAVYLAFNGNYGAAFLAILLAAVFDFLDGLAARLLKAYSNMGKELDSLADMISFGLAPGALVFTLLKDTAINDWLPFVGFIIPVFSGLRLAKFNTDIRQSSSFLGLAVPANAIFWAGLIYSYSDFLVINVWIELALLPIFCFLMVSEIPMFALKIKNFKWSDNRIQYVFLIGLILLFLVLQKNAFAAIIVWYIVLSVFNSLSWSKNEQSKVVN